MSASNAQVSATISTTTKELLDRFTEELGFEQSFVVEQALLLFMASRRELPDEAFIPPRLVLENDAFDRLITRLDSPPAPTDALRELMRDEDD